MKDTANLKASVMSSTLLTSHPAMFWSKGMVPMNALRMLVTLDTCHEARSALNDDASLNMSLILSTWDTSQRPMSALNCVAPANIAERSVAAAVSHPPMSASKEPQNRPMFSMSPPKFTGSLTTPSTPPDVNGFINAHPNQVTLEVSHSSTLPYWPGLILPSLLHATCFGAHTHAAAVLKGEL